MPNLVQKENGSVGIEGNPAYSAGFVNVTFAYDSNLDNKDIFVAPRDFVVSGATLRPKVAGTDGGSVSVAIVKCASGLADSSGTSISSTTLNLKGTINTPQHATITASAAKLPKGSALTLSATGTTTAATGIVTVLLSPA